jgi:UDP-N-acetyl-2-amino-2-deoxyglucuronate dehydrogenase
MNRIKFAVVGCGHIDKRHASMLLGNCDFELVALCDVKPKKELGLEKLKSIIFFSLLKN